MLSNPYSIDRLRTALRCAVALCAWMVGIELQAANFSDSYRWTATSTNGGMLQQGDPTTLRWSIVQDNLAIDIDNVPVTGSNLVSYLDGLYGGGGSGGVGYSARPWFSILQSQFDMIASKTGLTFEYVNDSAAVWSSSPATSGQPDIRLGGLNFPNAAELGRGALPSLGGDIVLDTNNGTFSNPSLLGGVLQHELGHALGLLHVNVPGSTVLMTTQAIPTQGPQFDDLFALTRLYGDRYEKLGRNDTPATATHLGTLVSGQEVVLGSSTDDLHVLPSEVDFLTIDGKGNADVFRVDIPFGSKTTFSVLPVGPTYTYDPSPLPQQTLNATSVDNLSFQVLAGDGVTPIATVNQTGIGHEERLDSFTLSAPGTYYVRVQGQGNANQFYRLAVRAEELVDPPMRQLFRDSFGGSAGLNESIDEPVRQGAGLLNSPYSFTAATTSGEPVVEIENDKLVMRAVQGGAGGVDSPRINLLRNIGPEVIGERWLLSLDLHVTGSAASVDAGFALLLNDTQTTVSPLSTEVDLNVILTTNNRYRIVEKGGGSAGLVNLNNVSAGPNYFVQMLVDETLGTPRVTVALNGTVVLSNESITMSAIERYLSMQLVTLNTFPAQQSVYAEVDNLSLALLTHALTGDYNLDGVVNSADYTLWRDQLGMKVLPGTLADGDGNGTIDAGDYAVWKSHFGASSGVSVGSHQVPEPAGIAWMILWIGTLRLVCPSILGCSVNEGCERSGFVGTLVTR